MAKPDHDALPIFTAWLQFLEWLLPATEKFPKRVRFTFADMGDESYFSANPVSSSQARHRHGEAFLFALAIQRVFLAELGRFGRRTLKEDAVRVGFDDLWAGRQTRRIRRTPAMTSRGPEPTLLGDASCRSETPDLRGPVVDNAALRPVH